jgi:hypothetical protein
MMTGNHGAPPGTTLEIFEPYIPRKEQRAFAVLAPGLNSESVLFIPQPDNSEAGNLPWAARRNV